MKRTMIKLAVLLLLLHTGEVGTEFNFAQGTNSRVRLRSLESLKIDDVSRDMDAEERVYLIGVITTYYIAVARAHESLYVSPKLPIVKLLKFNYPRLKDKEEERGISVRNILRVLNSDPVNRSIIDKGLVKQETHKCSEVITK